MRDLMTVVKALADKSRVRVLVCLDKGEMCLCQIIELLGLAPSTVSRHMSILGGAGLVESRKVGRWVYYRLADGAANGCASAAIGWVRGCTRGDRQVQEDLRRLRTIRRMDREQLCRHYRSVAARR